MVSAHEDFSLFSTKNQNTTCYNKGYFMILDICI